MGTKFLFLVIFVQVVFLLDSSSATFNLLGRGFFQRALRRINRGSVCSPSTKSMPSFADLLEYKSCLKPITWLNGTRRHPDQDLRAHQVIWKYGYNIATYKNVTTQDGYILTVHRVMGNSLNAPRSGKPAVLLWHGIGTAADEWVLQNNEKKNLPMKLVNAGFEVWLINARGTDMSRGHVKYNSRWDTKYWDFTYHEMGVYDLPAVIELMKNETRNDKIFFIGHNYAANVYAAALSEKPELNDNIEASIFLGPTVFMGHMNNPLRPLFRTAMELDPFIQGQVNNAVRGHLTFGNWMLNPLLARFCTPTAIKCGVCGNLHFFLYGFDAPQITFNDIPNIVSKTPNSISFKTALHLGQNIKYCDFRKFDYGRVNNARIYGSEIAPQYNLTNLKAPMYIYYGSGDNLATLEDVVNLKKVLPEPTLQQINRVNWKLFNNADFVMAKDADTLVYNHVLENLKEALLRKLTKNPAKTQQQQAVKNTITASENKKSGADDLSVHVYPNNDKPYKPVAVVIPTTPSTTTTTSTTTQLPLRYNQRLIQETTSKIPNSRPILQDIRE